MINRSVKLSLIILGIYFLSGCESLHKNDKQVISSKSASFPIPDKGTYHTPITYQEIKQSLEKEGTLKHLSKVEEVWLKSVDVFPNHSKKATYKVSLVGHCYKTKGSELTYYISGQKIRDNYYVASLSDEGCFDRDAKAIHFVGFIHVKDNQVGLVQFKNMTSLKVQNKIFLEWLNSLSSYKKKRLGVDGDSVSGIKAYQAFFNAYYKEILPTTKKSSFLPSSDEGELLQDLLSKLKTRKAKATKERDAKLPKQSKNSKSKANLPKNKTKQQSRKSAKQLAREKHLSSRINNIDNFYSVGPKGIAYISKKDNQYYTYNIEGDIKGQFKKNELTGKVSWYPDSQQAFSVGIIKYVDLPHCTHWGNSHYTNVWTYSYTPVIETIKGESIYAWKEGSGYSLYRVPKKICESAGIRRKTCEVVRCNKWKPNKPVTYLARSKKDAYAIYYKHFK